MPELIAEDDLREVQRLPFCYLCGEAFTSAEHITRDHVPPKSIFAKEDRTCPLILPSHRSCNEHQSVSDKVIGQLIAVQHGRYPSSQRDVHLKISVLQDTKSDESLAGIRDTDLKGAISRWMKAFHSALYRVPLPVNTRNAIHPPMPAGELKDGRLVFEQMLIQQPLFVELIKKNRAAKRLDRVVCYNGKCVYECTWERMDDGSWSCIFALNIYDWRSLGNAAQGQRGCVGWYQPRSGIPLTATHGVVRLLEFSVANLDPLDPFGP